jgi:uncharacterized protein YjiS (DUF1127 family)
MVQQRSPAMIALHRHAFPATATRPRPIGELLLAGLGLVEGWLERRRQRRALLSLGEPMLKDIGLSRADVAGEAGKWFWQA